MKEYDKNRIDEQAEREGNALRSVGKHYTQNHKRTRQITVNHNVEQFNKLFKE